MRETLLKLRCLRQKDRHARRAQIQQERRTEEQDQREQQGEMKKSKNRLLAQVWAPLTEAPLAKLFGGGEQGKKMASLIAALVSDLPLPDLKAPGQPGQAGAGPFKPSKTESNPSQPNQTSHAEG